MSRLLDDDDQDLAPARELTLSTGSILAIFLGLVLLCGVFFGFGYNLGRKATTTPASALPVAAQDDSAQPAQPLTRAAESESVKPSPSSRPEPAPAPREPAPAPVRPTATPPRATPTAASDSPARPTPSAAPAVTPGGAFVVQIAAISAAHKGDADLLVNALHAKGYDVAEHTVTQDKLIHIQVGPYATKADAEAMRERLIVDGYNAIVK